MASLRHPSGGFDLFLVAWILLVSCVHGATPKTEQYIVTIDAGSSGSRVHVHKVSVPTSAKPIPELLSAVNQKIKPGLSTFADKVSSVADEHIKGLVNFAYDNVPADAWKETPIYLKATAGMRSIPREKADQIVAVVRASFSGTPFLFESEWVNVISGCDEAKFSWIATNYLNGRFDPTNSNNNLLGVLEMGGASMQISYPVPKTVPVDNKKILQIQLGPQSYHLYAHSYLGYGLDQAQELLAEQSPDKVGMCYPQGNTYTSSMTPGAGDYDQCYQAMETILKTSSCPSSSSSQQEDRCSIQGTMLPHWDENNIQFVAIENFYYTTSFLTQDNNRLQNLPAQGQSYCAANWDNLKAQFGDKEDDFSLQRYCFSSAYIMAVLDHGFGINMMDHTQVAHSVGDTDIDWAVGSVVHDVLQLHHTHHGGGAHSNARGNTPEESSPIGFKTIMVFGLFVLVIVAVVAKRRQRKYKELQH